jgi:hypothetical protein
MAILFYLRSAATMSYSETDKKSLYSCASGAGSDSRSSVHPADTAADREKRLPQRVPKPLFYRRTSIRESSV